MLFLRLSLAVKSGSHAPSTFQGIIRGQKLLSFHNRGQLAGNRAEDTFLYSCCIGDILPVDCQDMLLVFPQICLCIPMQISNSLILTTHLGEDSQMPFSNPCRTHTPLGPMINVTTVLHIRIGTDI